MTIKHIGEGVFIDTERVDAPEEAPQANIYPYAIFRSLEHVEYGLMLTDGGARAGEIDRVEVGAYDMEPLAHYWEFNHALSAIEETKGPRSMFEEDPLVEVTSKGDYDEALKALSIEDSDWDGPGLYDFRDSPPTYSGTIEEYELEELEYAADNAVDFMFQGEEWEDAYKQLAEEES